MKNKICFIIPYFGKLPKGFQFFLQTCKNNEEIDFLIFTNDKTSYDYSNNIKIFYMDFDECRNLFQKNFDFKIQLKRPYKLCDFRPAYGEVFKEYIYEYDFWGHCDVDMLWGNIKHFYTDDVLDKNDHLGIWGHCQLYRNNSKINSLFRIVDEEIGVNYINVLSDERSFGFDELPINRIFSKYCKNNYFKLNFANLNKYDYSFHLVNYEPSEDYKNKYQYFSIENGNLYRYYVYDNKIFKDEFCYLHLWCRPISYIYKKNNSMEYISAYPEKVINKRVKNKVNVIKRINRKNIFRYYIKSFWFNRKKITIKRIIFNLKGMALYKKGIDH